ncbi:MAG TPA: hypothetical protein VGK73_29700 [Polyangiaceae bacterium]
MALGVSACGGVPADLSSETSSTGTVALPLTATSGDTTYRLAAARFTIKGSGLSRVITPLADAHIHQETLPAGKYEIRLEKGWRLEMKGPSDTAYVPVQASLSSGNPLAFEVKRNAIIDTVFTFVTGGGKVDLSRGRVNVRIDVQDCKSYDGYAASIATSVVECLGTIGPNAFVQDDRGYMRRNFKECIDKETQEQLLADIDGFMGLQYAFDVPRDEALPKLVIDRLATSYACITTRWEVWKEQFDKSGISECPTWRKEAELGTPTQEDYKVYGSELPELPVVEREGSRPAVLDRLKINNVWAVTFENGVPSQQCRTPGECAERCAAGFPGFVIRQDGETVLTDPPPWMRASVYADPDNPFATPYYHPMSFSGALPGATISHYNRSSEDFEYCSFYDGTFHVETKLKPNCSLMPDGTVSCIGFCSP